MEEQEKIAQLQNKNNEPFNEKQIKLANKQLQILSLQTDINIEPKIKFRLTTDAFNKRYEFIIINEGINSIIDLEVFERIGFYNLKNLGNSSPFISVPHFIIRDKLESGDSALAQIPYENITQAWQLYQNPFPGNIDSVNKSDRLPCITMKIKYLRQSDKKSYFYTKIFSMIEANFQKFDEKLKTIYLYDPDESEDMINKNILTLLKHYEETNNWTLPKFDF
jgi:hypothetical protein